MEPSSGPRLERSGALQVLLVQVRDQLPALLHERLCFLERLAMEPDRVRSVNVVEDPVPTLREASAFDLVILGGAGAHAAYDDSPFTAPLIDLVLELVDAGRPFFGSCFGHQLLARALGGRVVHDPAREEIGTFDLTLTPDGRADELFSGFPATFPVHLGHHDRVYGVPPGTVSLARTERCPHQMIRVAGKPVYGSQFHSEMSETHMRERLMMYAADYLPADDPLAVLDGRLRPTRLVDGLLRRFVDVYVR
jgi:GMP synthase (glutamine-hydrolysing)